MRIRLLTYASNQFALRRLILNASAIASNAVDTVVAYSPKDLDSLGFAERCPNLKLSERGNGWWAWKPFLIHHELQSMSEDEWLLYCDVGRSYPFKIIDCSLQSLINWTEKNKQFCMPGILIPWNGPMSQWTKRDAFVLTNMDYPHCHRASPIQASFSLWRAGEESKYIANQWLSWCCDRRLITDDANDGPDDNLSDFKDHRHDQSLLTLLCIKEGIQGLDLGNSQPIFDDKNPAQIAQAIADTPCAKGLKIGFIKNITKILAYIETKLRHSV